MMSSSNLIIKLSNEGIEFLQVLVQPFPEITDNIPAVR